VRSEKGGISVVKAWGREFEPGGERNQRSVGREEPQEQTTKNKKYSKINRKKTNTHRSRYNFMSPSQKRTQRGKRGSKSGHRFGKN